MKEYKNTRSSIEPQGIEFTETKVFVAKNIQLITSTVEDKDIQEYQYDLIEYDKDEYIKLISDENEELKQQISDTQLALCDVYELAIGGENNG